MNKDFTNTAEIAKRGAAIMAGLGIKIDTFDLIMYIDAAHKDVGLDLDAMLAGRDTDLVHDLDGIIHNLDRATGKLTGTWMPRFTKDPGPLFAAAMTLK